MKKFASILLSMLMATGAIAAASAETYTGTAQGIGEVSVTLTVEDGKITAAEVVGRKRDQGASAMSRAPTARMPMRLSPRRAWILTASPARP